MSSELHDSTNGTQDELPLDPPDNFLPDDLPDVRRDIWAMHLRTQRTLAETDRLVWEIARNRGILGISTST
jgi:hypothetical protein